MYYLLQLNVIFTKYLLIITWKSFVSINRSLPFCPVPLYMLMQALVIQLLIIFLQILPASVPPWMLAREFTFRKSKTYCKTIIFQSLTFSCILKKLKREREPIRNNINGTKKHQMPNRITVNEIGSDYKMLSF